MSMPIVFHGLFLGLQAPAVMMVMFKETMISTMVLQMMAVMMMILKMIMVSLMMLVSKCFLETLDVGSSLN